MTENARIEEQKTETIKKLGIMLDYLGLEASLKAGTKGEKISVIISSEEAGRIIGRKGQTLESLQMLLNRMMFKADKECPRILLDMDGYSRNNRTPMAAAPSVGGAMTGTVVQEVTVARVVMLRARKRIMRH